MTDQAEQSRFPPLYPEHLTWAALLAHWVEFARSAVALPDDTQGRAWRAVVPEVIQLQAVYFALGELGGLPDDQRRLGLDRAEVLIDRSAAALSAAWEDRPPESVDELVRDARRRLAEAAESGGSATDAPAE